MLNLIFFIYRIVYKEVCKNASVFNEFEFLKIETFQSAMFYSDLEIFIQKYAEIFNFL